MPTTRCCCCQHRTCVIVSFCRNAARSPIDGSTTAYIGPDASIGQETDKEVWKVDITARSNDSAFATATAVAVGVVAGESSEAKAIVTPPIQAYAGDRARMNLRSTLSIKALSAVHASAHADGLGAGGLHVGVAIAHATAGPNIMAKLAERSAVSADAVIVNARCNISSAYSLSQDAPIACRDGQNNEIACVQTFASASGGGALSGDGADVSAVSNPALDAHIGDYVTITRANVTVSARSASSVDATANGTTIGGVVVGLSYANASDSTTSSAYVGQYCTIIGGDVTIDARHNYDATGDGVPILNDKVHAAATASGGTLAGGTATGGGVDYTLGRGTLTFARDKPPRTSRSPSPTTPGMNRTKQFR